MNNLQAADLRIDFLAGHWQSVQVGENELHGRKLSTRVDAVAGGVLAKFPCEGRFIQSLPDQVGKRAALARAPMGVSALAFNPSALRYNLNLVFGHAALHGFLFFFFRREKRQAATRGAV